MAKIIEDPIGAYLENMRTGERKQFFINPAELSVVLKSKWKESPRIGYGNVPMIFERNENLTITFSIMLSAKLLESVGRVDRIRSTAEIADWRAFLYSLAMPHTVNDIRGWGWSEPPKAFLGWPNVFGAPIAITEINWKLTQFDTELWSLFEVATVKAKLNLGDVVLWGDDVRATGWELY